MSNYKVLVFGGNGQLGQCLKSRLSSEKPIDITFLDSENGDILNPDLLALTFKKYNPDYVINCAAYTAVDHAEDDIDRCRLINKQGPANLAKCCAEFSAKMIHISTDFVFEGDIPKILNEEHETNPINLYGITKLEGEREISRYLNEYYILRTSWLYSEFGNNFVKTMIRLAAEKTQLGIIADQIGTPTYAVDLADVILQIIEKNIDMFGIYHYSNEGVASWYDFAKGIFEIAGITIQVNPIPGKAYPSKATRPPFSVMDKTKIKETFDLFIPYWRDSLIKCIEKLD